MRQHRHLDLEQRRVDFLSEIFLVAFVLGVGNQRGAGGEQFGAGRLDVDRRAISEAEGDTVVEAGVFAAFQLGLRHGGLEGHIPQARRVLLVDLAARQIAQERLLRHAPRMLADRMVSLAPIHRHAQRAPQRLEELLVLPGELLAQFDEVLAADRHLVLGVDLLAVRALEGRLEIRIVLERRIHAHAVVVLHAPLGRQTVVVPAHRVEHVVAAHALVARDHVGMRVGEHMPHMQRAGDGRRRGVDGVDGLAVARIAETVHARLVPHRTPLVFQAFDAHLVGKRGQLRIDARIGGIAGSAAIVLLLISHEAQV